MMDREYLFLDAQSRTHLREGTGDQSKPPLLVTHCPQDFAIAFDPPPIVNMQAEVDLFFSISLCQARTNPRGVHAEVWLRLQSSGMSTSHRYLSPHSHMSASNSPLYPSAKQKQQPLSSRFVLPDGPSLFSRMGLYLQVIHPPTSVGNKPSASVETMNVIM
jgi:hypothetical protein